MAAPPLAFVLSIIALFKDESKKFAIAGFVISVLSCSYFLLLILCI